MPSKLKCTLLTILSLTLAITGCEPTLKQSSVTSSEENTSEQIISSSPATAKTVSETISASEVTTETPLIASAAPTTASSESASAPFIPPATISSQKYRWILVYSGTLKGNKRTLPIYLDLNSIQKDPDSNRYLYQTLTPLTKAHHQYEQFKSIKVLRGVDCDKNRFVIVEPPIYNTAIDGSGQNGEEVATAGGENPSQHKVIKKIANNDEFKTNVIKYVCPQQEQATTETKG